MSDTILGGNWTIFYAAENNQKCIKWTGSTDGTNTLNELYSALQKLFDDAGQMDDTVPIKADTPSIYRLQNQWFIDDNSIEHLTGGSLFSSDWVSGTDEHVLVIGYSQTTEFNAVDVGRNIVGVTSGDEGTILDFNTDRNLVWIRPDDPATSGDEFDNGAEVYRIGSAVNGDPVGFCTQDDNTVFTDQTDDANDVGAGDVEILPAVPVQAEDFGYIGFAQKFSKIIIDRAGGTQGSGGSTELQYSQGGGVFAALSGVVDGTGSVGDGSDFGFDTLADGDEVTFTVPSDWAIDSVDGSAELFFIRVRVVTTITTGPVFDQIFISGVGAGAFTSHNRHGVASKAGESAWAGLTTVLTREADTHVYLAQEDPDLIIGDSREVLVTATKGTADWWNDGQIDILLKVKEADNVFGALPGSSPVTAVATAFARQYSKNFNHFILTALPTAGGNSIAPVSTSDDPQNTTGHRNLIWDLGSSETLVDEELLMNVGTTTIGNLDAAIQDDGGVFVDDTTDINDAGASDVAVFPATEVANDAFYFGKDNLWTVLLADIGTQGVSSAGATLWEYFDGTIWQDLEAVASFVDDSDSGNGAFTAATGRHVTQWTVPSDWQRTNITNQPAGAPENLYYVRVRIVTANYSVIPLLTLGFVGGELQTKARMSDSTITTPAGAAGNGDYYLLGDPQTDFSNDDVVVASTSRKSFDINGAPTNTGPASDTSTATHGAFTVDVDENDLVDPYSIDINNPVPDSIADLYERFKFLTRRGETASASTDGQPGQFYLGSELQIEYTGQAGGNFVEGQRIFDQTSEAEAIVVADHDDGGTGDLILRTVRGTFAAPNVISGSPDPTQVMDTDSFVFQDDGGVLTDDSADALSAGGADVDPFPAVEANNDAFYIGAVKPWSKATIDIATQGVDGGSLDGLWEYWNGAAWVTLEGQTNFVDGTVDFTAAAGVVDLDFDPPIDWQPRGLSDGIVNSQTLFFVRNRLVVADYSTNPILDQVSVLDLVTATIGSVRIIAVVPSAPFGTFPGGSKWFEAPGSAIGALPSEILAADVQNFDTIDDDGTVRTPPNKQSVDVTNVLSGDTVAAFIISGGVITKSQYTLAAGNNQSDTTIVLSGNVDKNESPAGTGETKVRVVSVSGEEHRYRYSSFTTTTITLATGIVGGTSDGGNSSNTRLHDTAGTPFASAEVGDYVRNTTQGEVVRITNVVNSNEVDTEPLSGVSQWDGDSYDYNVLMENYPTGQNVYIPIIELIADATNEAGTLVHTINKSVRVDVRRATATAILPFTQDVTFGSSGVSIVTTRTEDTIIT